MSERLGAFLVFCAIVVGAFVAGYMAGARDVSPVKPIKMEEARTAPNDVALEVKPGAKPKLPAPSKPHGGTVVSTTEITVTGKPPVLRTRAADGSSVTDREYSAHNAASRGGLLPNGKDGEPIAQCYTASDFECPETKLRLDLIEVDGKEYMAVMADDGREVTGRFLPYKGRPAVNDKRIVATYSEDAKQVALMKDAGRLSYGLALTQTDSNLSAGVALGWSWH